MPILYVFDAYFEIKKLLGLRETYNIILFLYVFRLNGIIIILQLWLSYKNRTIVFNNKLFASLKTQYNIVRKEGLLSQMAYSAILHGIGIIIATYSIVGLSTENFLLLYFMFVITSIIIFQWSTVDCED
jgi:hypothetical protein